MKALSREDAIDATAVSLTRRDGLKLEKETTHGFVRWTRVMTGRRERTSGSPNLLP